MFAIDTAQHTFAYVLCRDDEPSFFVLGAVKSAAKLYVLQKHLLAGVLAVCLVTIKIQIANAVDHIEIRLISRRNILLLH